MKDAHEVLAGLKGSDVPHAAEILHGIAEGTIAIEHADFSGAGTSCAHLHDIYDFRSRPRAANASPHSKRLREDSLRLTERLAHHKGRSCFLIGLSKEPNISYGLFVLTDFSEFLGCYMSYDRRKTSDDEWKRIWGPEEAQPGGTDNSGAAPLRV